MTDFNDWYTDNSIRSRSLRDAFEAGAASQSAASQAEDLRDHFAGQLAGIHEDAIVTFAMLEARADKRRRDMTDAPEKIWAHPPTTFDEMDVWQTSETDGAIEYTRTDVTDARIEELEMALLECREEIEGLYQDAAGASL